MSSRKYWVMLPPSRSAAQTIAAASRAQDMGLEGVFSIQLASDPWVPLAAVAGSTPGLRLATGIAHALATPPFLTAVTALDLDRLSEGRFTLGLGTSVRSFHIDHYGVPYDPPVRRLAEAVNIIKLVVSGSAPASGRFDGEFWKLDFLRLSMSRPLRPDLPIWISALRTPLVRLAGCLGDGLIGHPSWSLSWARQQVLGPFADALSGSGRHRSDVEVNLWHVVAPNTDPSESVQDARRHVARYGAIAQYESYFDAHGFGAEARRLQDAASRGVDGTELVPEEMARTFVVCGTPDDVRRQVEPLWEIANSLCLQPPPVTGEKRRRYEAVIAETFYG
jgi:alkanesulfonate monooxygenase SsuD/methylene tetrahydromethanopterin reductase-like flavin-dependent oxidoreductase (luciferase family)